MKKQRCITIDSEVDAKIVEVASKEHRNYSNMLETIARYYFNSLRFDISPAGEPILCNKKIPHNGPL